MNGMLATDMRTRLVAVANAMATVVTILKRRHMARSAPLGMQRAAARNGRTLYNGNSSNHESADRVIRYNQQLSIGPLGDLSTHDHKN